jgi:hypothetical protein
MKIPKLLRTALATSLLAALVPSLSVPANAAWGGWSSWRWGYVGYSGYGYGYPYAYGYGYPYTHTAMEVMGTLITRFVGMFMALMV